MTSNLEKEPIYEKLEYDYLINDDDRSLDILMSLLDEYDISQKDIGNFKVKTYVLRNLKRYFHFLTDIDSIIEKLNETIGSCIDRFEVIVFIKARGAAIKDKKMIDELENRAISYYGPEYLLDGNDFLSDKFSPFYKEALKMVEDLVREDKNFLSNLYKEISQYCKATILDKILNLDRDADKQLQFDFSSIYTSDITLDESKKIYYKTLNYMYTAMVDAYCDYYVLSLGKEVLKRYY